MRDLTLFINDILTSINNIESFAKKLTKEKLLREELYQSAIIRQIEIIGEAVKNLPDSFRKKYPEISWNKIAGMRDIVIHSYFKVDLDAVWNVVKRDLPELKKEMKKIIEDMKS